MLKAAKIAGYGALLLLLLFVVSACAENKTDDATNGDDTDIENGDDNGDDETVEIGSITLLASSPELPSASGDDDVVNITAYVRDTLSRSVADVDVIFSVDNDGHWEPVSELVTDSNGTVEIKLSTPTNKANREITVTASAEGVSSDITIQVIGTTLSLNGPSSAMVDSEADFTLTLQDSAGNGISGAQLNDPDGIDIDSAADNPISIADATTNDRGEATFTVEARSWAGANNDTITVSGFGVMAQHTFNITADTLLFITPDPAAEETEVELGDRQELTVQWQEDGNWKEGGKLCFYTNRGEFVSNGASTVDDITDADGQATVEIVSSDAAGPATITAKTDCTDEGLEAQVELLFVATEPTKLTLQASPSVIAAGEQSSLVAVIRDDNNNPVKNQTVNFSFIEDATSGHVTPGTVTTDRYGRAETTFTAGEAGSSGQEEVIIQANVQDTAVLDDVTITVGGEPLYISLFYADTMEVPDQLRYRLPSGVMVTDSGGQGVGGVEVSLALWPTHYHKGEYQWDGNQWDQIKTAEDCPNEDIARDGDINNPLNDDYNDNEQLDPGAVASLSTTKVTTDADGFADFAITYPKDKAWWVRMEVTATTRVSQTESTRRSYFTLPILGNDLSNEDQTPAGHPSPFGMANDCTDPN